MEVLEAIKSGKSVSKFKPTPVPEQKIQAVFNAARLAPSADNLQPWKFIVVNDEDVKRQVAAACTNAKRLADAPILVVACARLDEDIHLLDPLFPVQEDLLKRLRESPHDGVRRVLTGRGQWLHSR